MALNYCGGIPELPKPTLLEMIVTNNGIELILGFKKRFIIPISEIQDVTMKTDEQLSKDVTLTRLLLLGVFAFGAKKKTKQITNYLVIEYMSNGILCSGIFTGDIVATRYSSIVVALQSYLKENPKSNSPNIALNDTSLEIEKFYNLSQQGIISEEEFIAKKKQLLGL